MDSLLNHFRLDSEKEEFAQVIENVDSGVEFKGTNLWILVFAIFIASLGLNVNSTAVVIGAMLVSPLMGPIIGLGMGMAINDLALLRKALSNYLFALVIGLTTSTIFFALSPLREASSEILSRTSPNIYDVLIALFGGFAGILAVSSRKKANVIPGVAIATALMPPLCTAGFGIANWNFTYFSGAMYLFVINTVFISLATLVTARFLKFPYKHLPDEGAETTAKRIVYGVVLLTLLPSIYFGYDIVQQNRFSQTAASFINNEAVFPNDYLLKKSIDAKAKTITLTYGGQYIPDADIEAVTAKMSRYQLDGATLKIEQGFAYAKSGDVDEQSKKLTSVLNDKEKELRGLKEKIAADDAEKALGKQVFDELRVQYPAITSCVVQKVISNDEKEQAFVWIAIITSKGVIPEINHQKIEDWLKVRLSTPTVDVFYDEIPLVK
ncbi:MAG: TIGR00341 family protein [Acidobacteriota bacterium]